MGGTCSLPNNIDGGELSLMNSNVLYNFLPPLPTDTDIPSPYAEFNIQSAYYDEQSLIHSFANSRQPLFLSLNTQSLLSKHENIKTLISLLSDRNLYIDILALQETPN